MVNSAMALLAAGDTATPLRAFIYLAVAQHPDGGFAQNFWVNGEAYWTGIQLDEVAFPIMLAWRLHCEERLAETDPSNLVRLGAAYLIRNGPVTQQERWEEASGYSPSTLASNIAALICASLLFHQQGDHATAVFIEEYADYLEAHVEAWTTTTEGSLLEGTSTYYMRILPETVGQKHPAEDKEARVLHIANHAPGEESDFRQRILWTVGFCSSFATASERRMIPSSLRRSGSSTQLSRRTHLLDPRGTGTTMMAMGRATMALPSLLTASVASGRC